MVLAISAFLCLLPLHGSAQELRMLANQGVLREAPDPNSRVVATVPGGTALEMVRELRVWLEVRVAASPETPARVGYVSVSDVEWVVDCSQSDDAPLQPGDVFQDCDVSPQMVVVPAGRFIMGSPASELARGENEGPQREVVIGTPFAVGVFEVRFREWEACARVGACRMADDDGFGRGIRPVINVAWGDAQDYLTWLSSVTGANYRLLSEAEWEYVARAGTQTARFWTGGESEVCRYANVFDQTSLRSHSSGFGQLTPSCEDGYARTAPTGSFLPNLFGLYDVLGNVWEWTQDCYHESNADAPSDGSARESGDCAMRVVRGAGWFHGLGGIRSAFRVGSDPGNEYNSGGFRVARDLR